MIAPPKNRQAFSMPETFVVLDVETTGLNHRKDRIIEIAAVKYEDGAEAGCFEALVNPRCEISKVISSLTGITNLDLANMPCIEEILPSFLDFLGSAPVVAHNASFDVSFLMTACAGAGLDFKNESIDTLNLSRRAFPEFISHSLENLKKLLSIPVEISHRALPDVRATSILYSMCLDRLREIHNAQSE